MDIVYGLLPAALVLAGIAVVGFIWATSRGQYDDLETPALRMLADDDKSTPSKLDKKAELNTDK